MNTDPDSFTPTRREFLGTAAALTVATMAPGTAEADPAKIMPFEPVAIPEWVRGVTSMAYLTAGEVPRAAKAGVQVIHTNLVWPHYPLRRDGGGLSKEDAEKLKKELEEAGATVKIK